MLKALLTACALMGAPGNNDCRPEPAAEPSVPAASREMKEWTVMVYMNARNNLEKYGVRDLNEMEAVGSGDKINIVAELGLRGAVNRYLVGKDANPSQITSPVVQSLGRQDMGDYRHLAEFGRWARANYPAKRYMLIVWDHGTGWIDKGGGSLRGVSYDYETHSNITTPQLGQALKEIGKVDLLAFDACLMQMAEVAFEAAPYADYILGSEQTVPGDGYPYDAWLPALAGGAVGPEELGRAVIAAYISYYDKTQTGASLALVRAGKMAELAALASDWAVAARSDSGAVASAKMEAQHYTMADNKDMADFVGLAGAGFRDQALKQKSEALVSFITRDVVAAIGRAGGLGPQTRGLAVYIPEGPYFDEAYGRLQWDRASGWGNFARWTQTLP